MPTTLTTPEVKVALTSATVDAWDLWIERNSDLSVDLTRSKFRAVVRIRDQDGSVRETRELERAANAIPAALRARLASLHLELVSTLRSAGILPAGTDTADL